MNTIYRLFDPRTGETFYIGQTKDIYKRFFRHINCEGANFAKNTRIMEIRAAGRMVGIEELEFIEEDRQANKRERYWISHYLSLGAPLTNITFTARSYRTPIARHEQDTPHQGACSSEQKRFTPEQERQFRRYYQEMRSIKAALTRMHVGYGRYHRHASEIAQGMNRAS